MHWPLQQGRTLSHTFWGTLVILELSLDFLPQKDQPQLHISSPFTGSISLSLVSDCIQTLIVLCEFSVGDVNECLHPIEGTNRLRTIDPIHVCLVEPVHLLGLPTGA